MSQAEELLASLTEEVPVHSHEVDEADVYLVIDPVSRKIEDSLTKKVVIMQYDHESKRFQFELPRYISGHDMSLCNRVYIHWNNIGTKTGNEEETVEENADLHEVTDLRIDPDNEEKVICSWLVKRNSTQLVGVLSFLIQYECVDENGNSTYEFHSDFYDDVDIREGRKNSAAAVAPYSDILEQWYARLFGAGESAVNDINETLNAAQQTAQEALTNHLEAIDKESATQQAAIEDAGLKALNSIPPEYAEVYRMSEESMRSKADAIILQAEGNPISVSNASNDPLQSLRIFGKTEQVKTNGYQLLDLSTIKGVNGGSVEVLDNGQIIKISGSSAYCRGDITIDVTELTGKTVYLSGAVSGGNSASISPYVIADDGTRTWTSSASFREGYTIPSNIVSIQLMFLANNTGTNLDESVTGTFKDVMLSLTKDVEWEPYTGGKPSPNPEYPQELESVENAEIDIGGTATDYEPYKSVQTLATQRTLNAIGDIKDELIYDYQTDTWQYIQRIGDATLDGTKNYKINSYNLSTEGVYIFEHYLSDLPNKDMNYRALSDKLIYSRWDSILNAPRVPRVSAVASRIMVYLPDQTIITVEDFTAYVTENPIRVLYELATPIITELTTEEVLAFKQLRTNKPNTVIQNGVGAHMIVEYGADTEIFLRECQPKPTDEQVQGGIDDYLNRNPIQIPSDEHIRAVAMEMVGIPPNDGKTYFYSNKGWVEVADADNSEY